jgi:putative efflux protein, MATE family
MIVGTTYGLDAIMDIMADIIRGMGSSVMPMIVTLIGACGFRVVWIYTIFATHHDLRVLYISYPISWILTSLTHIICYFIVKRRRLSGLTEGVPSV